MTTDKAKPTPESPAQIAARLYAEHGPMPDHLLRKTAAVLRDAHREQAQADRPA